MTRNRNVYMSFIFIALGGLLFGYIIGVTSNVITKGQLICADDYTGPVGTWTSLGYSQCYILDAFQTGFLTSLNLIGGLASSVICFKFADNMGRKLEVQVGAALYFAGTLIAVAVPTLWGLYLGLFIYGLGIGFAMHAAPVYIAEVSPADIRGFLVSAKEAVIVLGIFLGFFFGWAFSSFSMWGWRLMLFTAALFAIVMECGISFIPQSPRYLLLMYARNSEFLEKQRIKAEAGSAMQFFRQAEEVSEVESEMELMIEDITASASNDEVKITDAFGYPRPLTIGCGLMLLQQITGQPSVLYFQTNIFKSAGFGGHAAVDSVLVGAVKLVATLFTAFRVEAYGRRPLLFAGIGMMTFALAVIGSAFLFRTCKTPGVSVDFCKDTDIALPQAWGVATVIGLMVYVSGYQVGFGPISWLMVSEVFPLKVRGAAMSIAAITNFAANIAMTFSNSALIDALTTSGVFWMYFGFSIASLVFVYFFVPETKGKTLEEIEVMLSPGKRKQDS